MLLRKPIILHSFTELKVVLYSTITTLLNHIQQQQISNVFSSSGNLEWSLRAQGQCRGLKI